MKTIKQEPAIIADSSPKQISRNSKISTLTRAWIRQLKPMNAQPPHTTGFTELDQQIGGWHRGGISVIAGHPSMGVVPLASTFAEAFARNTGQVVWLGREVDLTFATDILVLRNTGIDPRFTYCGLSQEAIGELQTTMTDLSKLRFHYYVLDVEPSISEDMDFLNNIEPEIPTLVVYDSSRINDDDQKHPDISPVINSIIECNSNVSVLCLLPMTNDIEGSSNQPSKLSEVIGLDQIADVVDVVMCPSRGWIQTDYANENDSWKAEVHVLLNHFGGMAKTGPCEFSYPSKVASLFRQ